MQEEEEEEEEQDRRKKLGLACHKPVESYIVSWRVLGMSTLQSMLHTTVSTEFRFFKLSFISFLVFSSHHHGNNIFLLNTSLIPRPLPPRGEAWYTLLAQYSITFSAKKLKILTKNTELSLT